jgi:undecaprenyl pyrophosphate synthase
LSRSKGKITVKLTKNPDFYVRDKYWPDFDPQHFDHALAWYRKQDQTLGG